MNKHIGVLSEINSKNNTSKNIEIKDSKISKDNFECKSKLEKEKDLKISSNT